MGIKDPLQRVALSRRVPDNIDEYRFIEEVHSMTNALVLFQVLARQAAVRAALATGKAAPQVPDTDEAQPTDPP